VSLTVRTVVRHADFTLDAELLIAPRGITAVYGHSGSGKSTLLRCVAGLERSARGEIHLNGQCWQDATRFMPAHQRPVGLVFQDARLFPHLSVRGNLQFALRRAAAQDIGFDAAVGMLGVGALLDRSVDTLSGGQRQRVAIARALLTQPRLLLLDEPLANLDLDSRAEILPHLERLHAELAMPMIYVTHQLGEVMRLADELVLLRAGRVLAAGPLPELLVRTDLPLAHLAEAGVILRGRIAEHDASWHLTLVEVSGSRFAVARRPQPPGSAVRLRVDARDVSIALERPAHSSISNILPAQVLDIHDDRDAAQQLVRLQAGDQRLLARLTRRSVAQLGLAPGKSVFAQVKSVALMD